MKFGFEALGSADDLLTRSTAKQRGGCYEGGSVTLLRPDASPYPGSAFSGGGQYGLWAATIDGTDAGWISTFAMPNSLIVELCGVHGEPCPPGFETGDPMSPPGGYAGGGNPYDVPSSPVLSALFELRTTPCAQAKPITPPLANGKSVRVAIANIGIATVISKLTAICHDRSTRIRRGTMMCNTRKIVT